MEGHQLMDWLRSRWEWMVRNGFLTCVIVFAIGLLIFRVVMVCRHWGWIVTESGSTIIRNLGLVIGGLIAIGFGIWRGVVADRQAKASLHQAETSHRGLLNERYQKGAEMIGSNILSVRLGGIYALQRLAEEEPEQYHVKSMRLLCAFVRHPTKAEDRGDNTGPTGTELKPNVKDYRLREDVQAAMAAIGTRSAADVKLEEKENCRLSLLNADLTCALLIGANLTNVILSGANLTRAFVRNANLANAELVLTNFSEARGLTQSQLDQAERLISPPKLGGLRDVDTGDPLEWRGGVLFPRRQLSL